MDVKSKLSECNENNIIHNNGSAMGALKHRDFLLFWIGLLVSTTGSWMQITALSWLVFQLTGSKMYLGIVGAVGTVPVLLFSLPAGVIADRFSKRKLVIMTQTLAGVQASVLAALDLSHTIHVWHIIALAGFAGLINALDMPARQAMTIELTGKKDLVNGIALNSSAFNGARILGPAIAGAIVAAKGTGMCFLINAVSFLAVIFMLLIIRPTPLRASDNSESMISQIREGIMHVCHNPLIRDLVLMTAIASVFVLQFATLMPALAKEVLGVGAKGYGAMMSATGVGALIAALSVAAIGHKFRQGIIVMVGAFVTPVGLIALSISRNYVLSILCLVVIGWGMMMFLAVSNSIIQLASPDSLRGRVLSVRTLVFMGFAPIGSLQIGAIAERFGVASSMAIGAVIFIVATIYLLTRSRAVRDFR